MSAPGRNDPCPCGSGAKYKRCCLDAAEADARLMRRGAARRAELGLGVIEDPDGPLTDAELDAIGLAAPPAFDALGPDDLAQLQAVTGVSDLDELRAAHAEVAATVAQRRDELQQSA